VDSAVTSGKTKTVSLACGDITADIVFSTSVGSVPTGINSKRRDEIAFFVGRILEAEHLKQVRGEVVVTLSSEMGNKRRENRRENVATELKAKFNAEKKSEPSLHELIDGSTGNAIDWDVEPYLDRLVEAMMDDFDVDQAFGTKPKNIIADRNQEYTPKAYFPLNLKDVPYSQLFPDCGFDQDHGPKLSTIDEHYKQVLGSSPRPPHYLDWRAHKDLWLYDCFNIPPKKRPLFCSLSTQPIVPEPNSNYGLFTVIFKRGDVKNRCVHTLGDKQQPRRSMLLLLDDIFYKHTKKDKKSGQSHEDRAKVADDILARMELLQVCEGRTLEQRWALEIQRDKLLYLKSDLLIECQVFGEVKLQNHGAGVIMNEDVFDKDGKEAIQGRIETFYHLKYLPYTQALSGRTQYNHPTPDDRNSLLNKNVENFTDMPL